MAYTNHLLFNNIFLKNLTPSEAELASARHLVHNSARDWYSHADFSSPASMAQTWIQPLLNQQSLDLIPFDYNEKAYRLVAPWDREATLGICLIGPHGVDLNGFAPDGNLPKGQHWMIEAVNLALDMPEMRWVVLTNGVQWRLLDAQALRRYEAFLEVDLFSLLNGEEDDLAAFLFYRLLRLEEAFERDPDTGRNKLDALLQESGRATEATESYLKTTVSDNLDTPGGGDGIMAQLCMGLVRAVDPQGTKSFTDEEREAIYRDATYLLYRLLFILYAEARNLLPMERADYQAISLQRLIDEAAELRTNPQRLAKPSSSLWKQLSTLFNAIEFSDEYMGIPAYNGGLFENADKPYLSKYKIQNNYLAEALYELAFLIIADDDAPAERIDYRDLSVRHLGSLYEGMIEYRLFIAEEPLLARRDKDGKVKYLPAKGESRKPNDEVLETGKVYFAQSPHERKATGTHYTAEDLVARLSNQTVFRLLTERWNAFAPQLERWLAEIEQTPEAERTRLQRRVDAQLEEFVRQQIMSLRVCDPAMGSGHFLVHIAHLITNFTLWVLTRTPWTNESVNLAPDYWRQQVVENSLYGVDVNQMAVELAKLSLWLATMQVGRPLSFLDHHLKWGNSLLGTRLDEILAVLAYDDLTKSTTKSRVKEEQGQYGFKTLPQAVQTIQNANEWLEKITTQVVTHVEDIKTQEYDYEEAQRLLAPYKKIGDLLVARKMGLKVNDNDLALIAKIIETDTASQLSAEYQEILTGAESLLAIHRTIHWELEFSRIFSVSKENNGFDIVIGNPPFLGGSKISSEISLEYLRFIKNTYLESQKNTDLCAYFFRQGYDLLIKGGFLGLVATNTIGEGDTRESGLDVILKNDGFIAYVDRYLSWGGTAIVEVNLIVLHKPYLKKPNFAILDGLEVPHISSYLDDLPNTSPARLIQNKGKCFLGDNVAGIGFVVDSNEAKELLSNINNRDCVFPFVNGSDINQGFPFEPSRYAICFHDWSIEKAREYPELIKIVEKRVKPTRDKANRAIHKRKWWLFGDYRRSLRTAIQPLKQVLVRSRVSELHMLSFIENGMIYSDATAVFAFDDYYSMSILQSSLHEVWLRRQASTLRTDVRYTPSDCFQTFPFSQMPSTSTIGQTEQAGQAFYEYRQQSMHARQLGLTKLYNLFNNPACQDEDIIEMRRLHAAMDESVLACYGWQDIDLRHDFYPNDRKKIRFTPAPEAQRELFTRLIALNQEIAAQESAAGLVVESAGEEDVEEE